MRLLILQYAGDYREAVQRFSQGGGETYYAQKYSVGTVAELGQKIEEVSVVCCMTPEPYNEVLENGVRAIGLGFQQSVNPQKVIQLLEEQNPTHLAIVTPIKEVLKWAIRRKVKTIVILAESIAFRTWRDKVKAFLLAHLLNNQQIDWVASYGITSSLVLKRAGVKSNKIIPWDFLISPTPGSLSAKNLSSASTGCNLFYVGAMSEAKGVGDILDAVAKLHSQNFSVKLKIAGHDASGIFKEKAEQLKIDAYVEFLGLISNNEIEPLMREADLVLVPSRHEYPEGFPLVIHHALCARTPLLASDHPMFMQHLTHGENAMVFPAGNPAALAEQIEKVMSNPSLYARLSQVSYDTWHKIRLPVKWADLFNRWMFDSAKNRRWFLDYCLASPRYTAKRTYKAIGSELLTNPVQ